MRIFSRSFFSFFFAELFSFFRAAGLVDGVLKKILPGGFLARAHARNDDNNDEIYIIYIYIYIKDAREGYGLVMLWFRFGFGLVFSFYVFYYVSIIYRC